MPDARYHHCLRVLIGSLNAPFLAVNGCFLSGATPVIFSLDEYRTADSLVLSCFGQNGYRQLREVVSHTSLGPIFRQPIELARPVRADRFGIRTYVMVDSRPIHIEIYKEDRFRPAPGCPTSALTLSRSDMFVERLLANADQSLGATTVSAPAVDLAIMVSSWGAIPEEAWNKALNAYGSSVTQAYIAAVSMLRDAKCRSHCVHDLSLAPSANQILVKILPKLLINS
jgi:hypothetical protein